MVCAQEYIKPTNYYEYLVGRIQVSACMKLFSEFLHTYYACANDCETDGWKLNGCLVGYVMLLVTHAMVVRNTRSDWLCISIAMHQALANHWSLVSRMYSHCHVNISSFIVPTHPLFSLTIQFCKRIKTHAQKIHPGIIVNWREGKETQST